MNTLTCVSFLVFAFMAYSSASPTLGNPAPLAKEIGALDLEPAESAWGGHGGHGGYGHGGGHHGHGHGYGHGGGHHGHGGGHHGHGHRYGR